MAMTKILAAAAVLVLTTAVAPAFAHDDDADHADHARFHDQLSDAHQRAHEEGFYSRAEHRAYHRALRDLHGDFHEDHPGNWHDHSYGGSRYYGYGWRRFW